MKSHIRAEKDDRFATWKTGYTEFYCLSKQTLFNKNKVCYENCRAFHAASYGICCFLIKHI